MGVRVSKFPVRRAAARKFAMRACAAAVCSVFSLGALGQTAVDQARTAAGQAAIERAQSTGVLAGLDRALKTPLEIVWLRTAAEADAWNEATLSQAAEGCSKTATPKMGCAVVGRTAWRYVFGGNGQFAPHPNDVARLVVSSLNLPEVPLTTGKLDLSGNGRLYLVTPEGAPGVRPTTVAVILAAGSSLQITDAVSPSIQIELKAPENQPLLIGNLATADISRMLALLVRPGVMSASEANVNSDGRVALRSGGEIQLASLVSAPGRPDVPPVALQIARIEPHAAEDFTPLAAGLEAHGTKIDTEAILLASLAPLAGMAGAEVLSNAKAVRVEPPAMDLAQDFTAIAAILESPEKGVSAEQMLLASLAPLAGMAGAEVLSNAKAVRVEPPAMDLAQDFTQVAAVFESPTRSVSAEQVLVASLAPIAGLAGAELLLNAKAVRIEPIMDFGQDFTQVAAVLESPTRSVSAEQVLVASLAPIAGLAGAEVLSNAKATRIEHAIELTQDFTQIAGVLESRAERIAVAMVIPAPVPAPMQVAAVAPAPQKAPLVVSAAIQGVPAPAPAPSSADIARMRAEIEAEIARDRERLAQPRMVGAPGAKRFVLGV